MTVSITEHIIRNNQAIKPQEQTKRNKQVMKKTRKTKHFYSLNNSAGQPVNIDLNNYRVECVKTGQRKQFYHKYLFNMIVRKYEGNIDLFRTTYVSRAAAPDKNQRRAEQLQDRISRLYVQISNLKGELADAQLNRESFPLANK